MAYNKVFALPFRRKREGRTDYKKRLILLKSKMARLVVRKSNKHLQAQLVEYSDNGDKVIMTVHTKDLKKYGWDASCSNIPAAYLLGVLAGVKAKGKQAILDIGLQAPIKGSRIFAVLKGAKDGGLDVNFSEEVLPSEDRLNGEHIAKYAKALKANKEKYDKLFSGYIKNKLEAETLKEHLGKVKEKILSQK